MSLLKLLGKMFINEESPNEIKIKIIHSVNTKYYN